MSTKWYKENVGRLGSHIDVRDFDNDRYNNNESVVVDIDSLIEDSDSNKKNAIRSKDYPCPYDDYVMSQINNNGNKYLCPHCNITHDVIAENIRYMGQRPTKEQLTKMPRDLRPREADFIDSDDSEDNEEDENDDITLKVANTDTINVNQETDSEVNVSILPDPNDEYNKEPEKPFKSALDELQDSSSTIRITSDVFKGGKGKTLYSSKKDSGYSKDSRYRGVTGKDGNPPKPGYVGGKGKGRKK